MQPNTLKLTTAFIALASLLSPVVADHELRFQNKCDFAVTPRWMWHGSDDESYKIGEEIAPGAQWTSSAPEQWIGSRLWGVTGREGEVCDESEGDGCTSLECVIADREKSPNGPGFCNLRRSFGFNIGMAFEWIGGDENCPGPAPKICADEWCNPRQACNQFDGCEHAITYCQTPSVGMQITFCPEHEGSA